MAALLVQRGACLKVCTRAREKNLLPYDRKWVKSATFKQRKERKKNVQLTMAAQAASLCLNESVLLPDPPIFTTAAVAKDRKKMQWMSQEGVTNNNAIIFLPSKRGTCHEQQCHNVSAAPNQNSGSIPRYCVSLSLEKRRKLVWHQLNSRHLVDIIFSLSCANKTTLPSIEPRYFSATRQTIKSDFSTPGE